MNADINCRTLSAAEVTAFVRWLDAEIARYERTRVELRAGYQTHLTPGLLERSTEQECYRTALQGARAQLSAVLGAREQGMRGTDE
ncbi:MAG: hypothetical protein Q8O67_31795 [Deltaproteobacteria bacterium]|nr:hypothetical protein [Deltaproteobacteria bacterium]